jgi:mannosyl-oligosaccharide alpha-1,2-mannosidase
MYRITKDPKYRQWGWEMFEAFREHTKVVDEVSGKVYAYTSLDTVMENPVKDRKRRDNMESFWLAETLKYFYLLFSDDSFFPLDSVVFNTEAHPLPKFDISGSKVFVTGWQRNTGEPPKPKPGSDGKVVRVDAPQRVEKVAAADAQKPAVAVPHEHEHDDTMEHGHIEESGKDKSNDEHSPLEQYKENLAKMADGEMLAREEPRAQGPRKVEARGHG